MTQLAGYNTYQSNVTFTGGSVAAGTAILPILIAPYGGITVKSAKVVANANIGAGTANYATLTLLNQGTAGTATTAIGTAGGTPGVAGGGTVAPSAFTVNSDADELTAGQYLGLKYVMTGALADNQLRVIVEWVHGKG